MSTPPASTPLSAWGFLPREEFAELPPHPSRTQTGDPHCRAVASYDITGAIQHFVLPLDRTKAPTLANQQHILRVFWNNSPMACDMCQALFASAVSVTDRCAFTFMTACSHQEDETEPATDSDSDDSHSYGSDDPPQLQDDTAENLATDLITADVGYNPIQGNLVVVKHTIVGNLPGHVADAEILDVLVEDFPILRGLVFRYIIGDRDDESRRFLPSPYVFVRQQVHTRLPGSEATA
ncbi:hypothetical protein C8F01DRAFT_1085190 [Mycena amicta]|nr:hypothetical protein C8F01DRAFT_1085190 [Mycena amicta]